MCAVVSVCTHKSREVDRIFAVTISSDILVHDTRRCHSNYLFFQLQHSSSKLIVCDIRNCIVELTSV